MTEPSVDIVDLLRAQVYGDAENQKPIPLCVAAADEIIKLRKQIESARSPGCSIAPTIKTLFGEIHCDKCSICTKYILDHDSKSRWRGWAHTACIRHQDIQSREQ